MTALECRRKKADSWNDGLGDARPSRLQRIRWNITALSRRHFSRDMLKFGKDRSFSDRMATLEREWRCQSGRRSASIPWALNDVVTGFWAGGEFLMPILRVADV